MTDDPVAAVLAGITAGNMSGWGYHTPAAWISEPIETGLTALADTIALHHQEGRMITCRPA